MDTPATPRGVQSPAELSAGERVAYERILDFMRAARAVDFRQYRQATIVRRVQNRMISANERDYSNYLKRLQADPEEAHRLLERLTIKVSLFFRHPVGFEALRTEVERRLATTGRPVSVWSAGCAQGEEAYSLAILLAELGIGCAPAPPVWATDLDPSALLWAHRASYPPNVLENVSGERLRAHFTELPGDGAAYVVNDPIRERVRFDVHDLCSPLRLTRKFDVICCRNTLIYFQPELQRRAQRFLHDCLEPGGLLLLGEAEWIHPDLAQSFHVLDRRGRLFRLRKEGRSDA